ncbi:MAG: hypothetical protein AAGC55_17080 [Myxococcota bacterium]
MSIIQYHHSARTSRTTTYLALAAAVLIAGCSDDGGSADEPDEDAQTEQDAGVETDGPERSTASVRFANFLPGSGAVDVCIADGPDADFVGPIVAESGDPAIAFREIAARRDVAVAATAVIRWVDGAATDCDTALPGASDTALDIADSGVFTVALLDADGAAPSDDPTTQTFSDVSVATPDSGRFYARFFNAAVGQAGLSVKQSGCAIPFAAFENTPYGALGMSPNDQANYFSASVTIGQTYFETDIAVCSDTTTEVGRLVMHRFNGGEIQFIVITGDGSAEQPYRFTLCIDTEETPTRCDVLP